MSKPRYLIASDFDDTLFRTSKPSPTGITIQKAYVQGFDDIFGEGTGEWFFSRNGFHGESPSQIIKTFLITTNGRHAKNATHTYQEQNGNFPRIIPESRDGTIYWDKENPQTTLTSMLVISKLGYLLQEIGTRDQHGNPWPLPCEGVLDFFRALGDFKEKGVPIDFAIISSGHEAFIRKALEVWNIPQPNILVTEDDVRVRQFPQDAENKFKPGVFPVALAHFKWLKDQRIPVSKETGSETRTRIMHIGDNHTKDLVMAHRSGIKSNLLFPGTSWQSITDALTANRDLLDGRPFAEVLSAKRNCLETHVQASSGKERR